MTEQDHGHPHPHAPVQMEPSAPRQPSQESIIRNQTQELNRINDNRMFLLSLIDELQSDLHAVQVENASLKERLEQYETPAAADVAEAAKSNGSGSAKKET